MTRQKIWKKKSHDEVKERVFRAINENINYTEQNVLGIPASYLDQDVFPLYNNPLLKDAPFMSTLIKNPNHIGCHTTGVSESFFRGTHELERELLEVCAVDILEAEENSIDGYVASGGTEANMQAMWVYRNYFMEEYGAKHSEIAVLCSTDSHYSMNKGANILNLSIYRTEVNDDDRTLIESDIMARIDEAKAQGVSYFIVVANMMTTMFGSVDDIDLYVSCLKKSRVKYKIHVDGAYGGFYYPFACPDSRLSFANEEVSSVTLDAHKMAQAPYGTGIFLVRKGMIQYANTKEASYVEGEDFTMIGSRSGANAIAIWMILMTHGPFGWKEKIFILQKRTEWLCSKLEELNIEFYSHPYSNITTIRSKYVKPELAKSLGLVPDNHTSPNWFKIVLMDHVNIEKLLPLIEGLS